VLPSDIGRLDLSIIVPWINGATATTRNRIVIPIARMFLFRIISSLVIHYHRLPNI